MGGGELWEGGKRPEGEGGGLSRNSEHQLISKRSRFSVLKGKVGLENDKREAKGGGE